jgi:endonuclease YncB( thermonuclease family)
MKELKVNEYDVRLLRAVDGDTVDVDIDLGFGMWLKDERVRIMGIDTPESRTRDKVEKLFGKAAKARLKELLVAGGTLVTEVMIEEGHCVPYFGGSKDDVQAQHEVNRQRLLEAGVVSREDYDKAVKLMEGK